MRLEARLLDAASSVTVSEQGKRESAGSEVNGLVAPLGVVADLMIVNLASVLNQIQGQPVRKCEGRGGVRPGASADRFPRAADEFASNESVSPATSIKTLWRVVSLSPRFKRD